MVYVEVPKYNASNANFGALQQSVNDTALQNNPYLGSNGFKYARYSLDLTKSLAEWVSYFRAGNISITLLEEGIRTELGSAEIYGSVSYIEYLRGYLYIPNAGNYSFTAVVDDLLIVNLAKYPSNSNSSNMETIIRVDSYLNDHYNPYISGEDSRVTREF